MEHDNQDTQSEMIHNKEAQLENLPQPQVRKEGRRLFWITFIATAIPIIVFHILSPVLRVAISSPS